MKPTLKEVSAWVDVVSSEAPRNHWSRRVDHHDAMAIALAFLFDWAQKSDEQITPLTPPLDMNGVMGPWMVLKW